MKNVEYLPYGLRIMHTMAMIGQLGNDFEIAAHERGWDPRGLNVFLLIAAHYATTTLHIFEDPMTVRPIPGHCIFY